MSFEECLRDGIVERLSSDQFRYVDNSREYYYKPCTENMRQDKEWFQRHAPVGPDEFMRDHSPIIEAHIVTKAPLYDLLQDSHSKDTLLLVALYAILGHRFVKFPYYAADAIRTRTKLIQKYAVKDADEAVEQAAREDGFGVGYPLARYTMPLEGEEVTLYATAEFVYQSEAFLGYRYAFGDTVVDVAPGDYVLDCGACFGDTALMFAARTGEHGKVLSFEPHPEIARLFLHNRNSNPHLAPRITLAPMATSDAPGETSLILSGSSSHMGSDDQRQTAIVPLTTLDSEVSRRRWPRVDFIKMDIEGAELNALCGAIDTLRRFRPKLAICLYHNIQDFFTIPHFLKELNLGYQFYLEHHYMNDWETVLYAVAK